MINGADMKKAAWFATLLQRALPLSSDLPEALAAVDAAMAVQPEDPDIALSTWERGKQTGQTQKGEPVYRWYDPETGEIREQHIPPGTARPTQQQAPGRRQEAAQQQQAARPAQHPQAPSAAKPQARSGVPARKETPPIATAISPARRAAAIEANVNKPVLALTIWRNVPPGEREAVAKALSPEAREAIHKAAQGGGRRPGAGIA